MTPDSEHSSAAELIASLDRDRATIMDEARPEAVSLQHARGKLTARERIDSLLDNGSFREMGGLIQPSRAFDYVRNEDAPADGVVVGTGLIDERPAGVMALDFTVLGGSDGEVGDSKTDRQARMARDHGHPFVMLLDGGGHRIQEGLDSRHFARGVDFFQIQGSLSGWVPMAAAILGPGFAGPTTFAALSDFVVMVEGLSTMGLAGPALVRAATGEERSQQELGGSDVQAHQNGLADYVAKNEDDAISAVRRFLSYLPSNAAEPAPVLACQDPADRRDEFLVDAVPTNPRRAYDAVPVIEAIVDRDSMFELKAGYARNAITAFARLDGRPVGIIANQPKVLGGTINAAACDKIAHFVSLCDAFGLPLIYFIDVPGFLVGEAAEASGLARRAGKLLFELAQATVPRMSIVMRKGYGLAYVAMNGGRSFDADLAVAWPTAEISAMSVEGAVDVAFRKEYESHFDPALRRAELIAGFREKISATDAAAGFGIDDVIDPRDTRAVLIDTLRRVRMRREIAQPPRYHPVTPI